MVPTARAAEPGMKATSAGATTPFVPPAGGPNYKPVITPNGLTLPWKMVNGVKVFHLVAFDRFDGRPVNAVVVAPTFRDESGRELMRHRLGDEMIDLHSVDHLPRQRQSIRRDDGFVVWPARRRDERRSGAGACGLHAGFSGAGCWHHAGEQRPASGGSGSGEKVSTVHN